MDAGDAAPGWKVQPDGSLRWWDGQQWTDNYADSPPIPSTAAGPAVEPPPTAEPYYHLGAQVTGNTLTPGGWYPTAVVIEHQERAESLTRWAWMASGIGLVICGVLLGPLGIVLGLMARSDGRQWGQPIGWGPVILGTVSTVVPLLLAVFMLAGES